MIPEKLDSAINELIISVNKPKYKTNSYFKKQDEYRRIRKYINYILRESHVRIHDYFDLYNSYGTSYDNFYITGMAYKAETNRFKKLSYTYSDKDKKFSTLRKRLNTRASRRYVGIIPNGSGYKKCLRRINKYNHFLYEWYD